MDGPAIIRLSQSYNCWTLILFSVVSVQMFRWGCLEYKINMSLFFHLKKEIGKATKFKKKNHQEYIAILNISPSNAKAPIFIKKHY